ncbi:uncharacterized protein LOC124861618 isoform X3 [Girardinichthys multiradiatus]|uniref:uncharacterized protein LOC124861618 isoform X3 n=1 Tax=Girardinichthys multiradiatus TaxID=208333 RepID=UPI001FACC2FE|nr:uncharacterized protein LOC124861618 isoform X3 [Girardinichthys multiradiatus]
MLKPPKTAADDQMDALRNSFLLLLPCCVCLLDAEVTLVKTIGKEPDFIPICTNETSNDIILIVCKIRTERSSGEECRLLYREGDDFVHECDSRFTLKTRNHTVFLHLTSLTPADSGNYTCECSNLNGTHILHLNVTVRADEVRSDSAGVVVPSALTAAALFIILLTVILGFVHRRRHHREQPESCSHHKNEDLVEIEPYSTFIQKENGLYATGMLYDH